MPWRSIVPPVLGLVLGLSRDEGRARRPSQATAPVSLRNLRQPLAGGCAGGGAGAPLPPPPQDRRLFLARGRVSLRLRHAALAG